MSGPDGRWRLPGWMRRRPSFTLVILMLSVGAGIAVRLAQFLHNRSLWVDEALLALNVRDASFGDLAGKLQFNQVAPTGFLFAAKGLVTLLGDSEYVLRVIPLLSSIGTLALCYPVLQPLLGRTAAVTATVLLGVAAPAIYYAAEYKQYATEALITLVCVWALARARQRAYDSWSVLWLAVVGLLAILLSLPAVLVLSAAGGTMLFAELWRGDGRAARRLFGALTPAAIVFTGLYVAVLHGAVDRDYMTDYWRMYFLPFPPLSLGALKAWLDLPWQLMPSFGLPAAGLALFAFLVGVVELRRTDVVIGAVLLAPLLLAVIFSAAALYPLGGRLALYLMPAALALIGLGVRSVMAHSRLGAILLVLLLAYEPAVAAVDRLRAPVEREEVRPVLAAVTAASDAPTALYVHWSARPAFAYYRSWFPLDHVRIVEGRYPAGRRLAVAGETSNPAADFEQALERMRPEGWFLFSADWEDGRNALDLLRSRGQVIDSVLATGAAAYRVRLP